MDWPIEVSPEVFNSIVNGEKAVIAGVPNPKNFEADYSKVISGDKIILSEQNSEKQYTGRLPEILWINDVRSYMSISGLMAKEGLGKILGNGANEDDLMKKLEQGGVKDFSENLANHGIVVMEFVKPGQYENLYDYLKDNERALKHPKALTEAALSRFVLELIAMNKEEAGHYTRAKAIVYSVKGGPYAHYEIPDGEEILSGCRTGTIFHDAGDQGLYTAEKSKLKAALEQIFSHSERAELHISQGEPQVLRLEYFVIHPEHGKP